MDSHDTFENIFGKERSVHMVHSEIGIYMKICLHLSQLGVNTGCAFILSEQGGKVCLQQTGYLIRIEIQ